jgi:phosphate transport system protein
MQSYFQDELAKLRKRINKMFLLVNTQLEKSYLSVFSHDFETHAITTLNENRIDKLDAKIDKLCQRIFALAQPVATDLRFIMSSLRIGNEIERIGDIAMDIIVRSDSVRSYPETLGPFHVNEMLREVIHLTGRLAEAYANNNSALAKEIMAGCKRTTDSCHSVFQEIITQMTVKSDVIIIATDLILIIRDLERVGNHLEKIAESVVFMVEGKRLRHQGQQ